VFEASHATVVRKARRYAFTSLTTALLNAGGVGLVLLLDLPFVAAWAAVRAIVFGTWSYPLQRDFVFATPLDANGGAHGSSG
jgi:hypothetical protein